MTYFLTISFILIAVLMILVVLVQRGRGGGLAGAFGSGGGSSSAFGTKTGDVFTTVTVVLFVVFMLLGIWLNIHFKGIGQGSVAGAKAADTQSASPKDGTIENDGTKPLLETTTPPVITPSNNTSKPATTPPAATSTPAPLPGTVTPPPAAPASSPAAPPAPVAPPAAASQPK